MGGGDEPPLHVPTRGPRGRADSRSVAERPCASPRAWRAASAHCARRGQADRGWGLRRGGAPGARAAPLPSGPARPPAGLEEAERTARARGLGVRAAGGLAWPGAGTARRFRSPGCGARGGETGALGGRWGAAPPFPLRGGRARGYPRGSRLLASVRLQKFWWGWWVGVDSRDLTSAELGALYLERGRCNAPPVAKPLQIFLA